MSTAKVKLLLVSKQTLLETTKAKLLFVAEDDYLKALRKIPHFLRKKSRALYKAPLHLNRRVRTEIFIYSIYLYYGINIYGDENA